MTVLMGLDARLRLARLYLCTDTRQRHGDLADFLSAVFAAGVDIVRIREPGLSPEAELAALETARAAAGNRGIVCVDRSAKLAGTFQADMLHLGPEDGKARKARRELHQWALVGRSTSTTRELDRALAEAEVDYLSVGPVYAGSAAPGVAPVGLELVRHAVEVAPVFDLASKPWFAAGGISESSIDAVLEAGARRICVTRAITGADDPAAAAAQLRARVQEAWRADPAAERYTMQAVAGVGPSR